MLRSACEGSYAEQLGGSRAPAEAAGGEQRRNPLDLPRGLLQRALRLCPSRKPAQGMMPAPTPLCACPPPPPAMLLLLLLLLLSPHLPSPPPTCRCTGCSWPACCRAATATMQSQRSSGEPPPPRGEPPTRVRIHTLPVWVWRGVYDTRLLLIRLFTPAHPATTAFSPGPLSSGYGCRATGDGNDSLYPITLVLPPCRLPTLSAPGALTATLGTSRATAAT